MLVIRTQNLQWATSIGMSLILGGALSNLFDRMRSGEVEDFLDFYVRSYHWSTFNLADSAIVVGTGLIVVASAVCGVGARCQVSGVRCQESGDLIIGSASHYENAPCRNGHSLVSQSEMAQSLRYPCSDR